MKTIKDLCDEASAELQQMLQEQKMINEVVLRLAAVTSMNFAQKCKKVVAAERNTYDISTEIQRLDRAARMIWFGMSEAQVLAALKNQFDLRYWT